MVLQFVPIRPQLRISDTSPGIDAAQMKHSGCGFGMDGFLLPSQTPSNQFYESTGHIDSFYR